MKQGIEKVWDLFLHNNFFKIMLFAWLIVLGGILEVYLDNLFSSIVLYIGCFGLLGYALLFVLGGLLFMVIEEIEHYRVKKNKKKEK